MVTCCCCCCCNCNCLCCGVRGVPSAMPGRNSTDGLPFIGVPDGDGVLAAATAAALCIAPNIRSSGPTGVLGRDDGPRCLRFCAPVCC